MSKPTIRELLGWFTAEYLRHQDPQSVVEAGAALAERAEAVLKRHWPSLNMEVCIYCGEAWPCWTIRILEGER